MSLESVKAYLATYGLADKVMVERQTTATVEEAAQALGVEPGRIAKTMAFHGPSEETVIMIVAAGDVKISNGPFKRQFGLKARMLDNETCERLTGHHPGGVCPFDLENHPVEVWLDASLKRFPTVFPACGSSDSCIELSIPQLKQTSHAKGWVDVCKLPESIQQET